MTRALLLLSGAALLAAAWSGAAGLLSSGLFTQRMILHVTLVAVAAPLLALGLAGSAADPTRRWPFLAAAIPAMLLEALVVWGWHLPDLHEAARLYPEVTLLEQASFLLVGLLLWLSVFGGGVPDARPRQAAGVLALLMTSMHMTLLGALITLAPRLLYDPWLCGPDAPLRDQQTAGLVMLLGGATSYLAGGLYLTHKLLRGERQAEANHAPLA